MATERILLVVNPLSGKGRGFQDSVVLEKLLAEANIEVSVLTTQYAGHAIDYLKNEALDDVTSICGIGGDGTIHEVVNGLMQREDSSRLSLAVVPAGTGNSLAAHAEMHTALDAARRIIMKKTTALDVLEVRCKGEKYYCINLVGWGAAAEITKIAEQLRWMGKTRYSLAAISQIALPRRITTRLQLDEKVIEDELIFVVACNTKYGGYRMMLSPDARTDNGLMDVIVLRSTSRWNLLRGLWGIADGSHLNIRDFELYQVSEMKLDVEWSRSLTLDGEVAGTSPFEVSVLPGALYWFC